MKKMILIILPILLIILGTIIVYNNYIKEETVNLSFDVEIYNDYNLSDFKEQIDCKLKEDKIIDTSTLGNVEIVTHCKNKDNRKKKMVINFSVVDTTKPIIILKDSFTVTEGYQKALTDVIISMDNYDSKPKREIIGDYDFNKVGSYNLTYKIVDNSGNETTKDFVLNVTEKQKNVLSNSYIAFSDIVSEHKSENTEIGIDVSKWQDNIDFKKVHDAGAEFVIIRIGHQNDFGGEYILDPYFKNNIESATKNGLKVGIYFYSYADSEEEAKKQVNWIIDNLGDYKLELPIVYDWESWSSLNSLNLSIYEFNKIADAFLNEIENKGYIPMLYSSKNYLENIWKENHYKTWLAHYTNKTNYEGEYYMWQLCSDGKISGINGYVDIDVLYK